MPDILTDPVGYHGNLITISVDQSLTYLINQSLTCEPNPGSSIHSLQMWLIIKMSVWDDMWHSLIKGLTWLRFTLYQGVIMRCWVCWLLVVATADNLLCDLGTDQRMLMLKWCSLLILSWLTKSTVRIHSYLNYGNIHGMIAFTILHSITWVNFWLASLTQAKYYLFQHAIYSWLSYTPLNGNLNERIFFKLKVTCWN